MRWFKRLSWIGVFAVAGCAGLKQPVLDPATGEPLLLPDGTERTNYDVVVDMAGGMVSTVTANPLWGVLLGSAGALFRPKLLGKKPV